MTNPRTHRRLLAAASLLLITLLAGCASTDIPAGAALADDLSCTLPTRCVSSLDGGLPPLQHAGPAPAAMAALRQTLAALPEAQVQRSEPLALQVIFTTAIGFQDEVIFKVAADGRRIDFRSRSLLGLYDLGKNRARMEDFTRRFNAAVVR